MTADRPELPDHGGDAALAAATAAGAEVLWTLSGAHIFPLYDAAVRGADPMRLLDVRHEQTAVFGAEGMAKLTRRPGFAALTAGPGVTNGVSAITSAWFNGSAVVVLGGRAPAFRWGSGALQELDHPPLLAPVTKRAATVDAADRIGPEVAAAFSLALSAHRGPVFLDIPMDHLYTPVTLAAPQIAPTDRTQPDEERLAAAAAALAAAERPVLILGSDVWNDHAEATARTVVEELQIPTITNGMGRGLLPAGHPLLVTRARSEALRDADLVCVAGAPLDFRLGYGRFGPAEHPATVLHLTDSPEQIAGHTPVIGLAGDLAGLLESLAAAVPAHRSSRGWAAWKERLVQSVARRTAADEELLTAASDPIHPARIYGELRDRLTPETVVIGDGGDFVSFAGRFIEPDLPGRWLDPGPFGCLGTGPGYAAAAALAHPGSPPVLLLGDGAAGFSLMDVDTLVRHRLPVVMVVGNNGAWGLEKHPMRMLYGYDVITDLQPQTGYDAIVAALGGAGETVTRPDGIAAALDRAFASGVPYLVNVITHSEIAYPRSTTGI
jgi:acetolactate synthase-1/2/3 large subunit